MSDLIPKVLGVKEYGCGSCLPFADEESLRSTIVKWRDNRELVRKAGRNARRAFEERYNWRTAAAPVLDTLGELGLLQ